MGLSFEKEGAFSLNGKPLDLALSLQKESLNFLTGPNGIGKTSLLTFLKMNHELLLPFNPNFMDQASFRPLSDLRVEDALKVLEEELPSALSWKELPESELLGIESLANKKVSFLSGGENQKVKLILSMMKPFDLFLGDEPLQHLDEENRQLFLRVFDQMLRQGKTLLIVEHDLSKYPPKRLGVENRMVDFGERLGFEHV